MAETGKILALIRGAVSGLKTEINSKADEPTGTKSAGKVYGLDSNLNPAWVDGGGGSVDPAVIAQAVDDWLDDHPEATTTVEDGSITEAKLSEDLAETIANKASAIIGSVSGESVTIDDNLPNTKLKDCKVIIDSESGVTGGKVFLYGKNFLDPSLRGASTTGTGQNWGQTNGYADGRLILPAGKYTLSISGMTSGVTQWRVRNKTENIVNVYAGSSFVSFTLTENTPIAIYISVSDTAANIEKLQNYTMLEAGESPTAFEAFAGQEVSFTFPEAAGTVYDATYDVTTGVLTVNTDPKTEYETEGHDITTVSGKNVILSDCGDVYVEYCADTTNYLSVISKQTDDETGMLLQNQSMCVEQGQQIPRSAAAPQGSQRRTLSTQAENIVLF